MPSENTGELARQTINHVALIAATLVDHDRVLDDYQLESYVKKAYKLLKIAEDQFSNHVCCDTGNNTVCTPTICQP